MKVTISSRNSGKRNNQKFKGKNGEGAEMTSIFLNPSYLFIGWQHFVAAKSKALQAFYGDIIWFIYLFIFAISGKGTHRLCTLWIWCAFKVIGEEEGSLVLSQELQTFSLAAPGCKAVKKRKRTKKEMALKGKPVEWHNSGAHCAVSIHCYADAHHDGNKRQPVQL